MLTESGEFRDLLLLQNKAATKVTHFCLDFCEFDTLPWRKISVSLDGFNTGEDFGYIKKVLCSTRKIHRYEDKFWLTRQKIQLLGQLESYVFSVKWCYYWPLWTHLVTWRGETSLVFMSKSVSSTVLLLIFLFPKCMVSFFQILTDALPSLLWVWPGEKRHLIPLIRCRAGHDENLTCTEDVGASVFMQLLGSAVEISPQT